MLSKILISFLTLIVNNLVFSSEVKYEYKLAHVCDYRYGQSVALATCQQFYLYCNHNRQAAVFSCKDGEVYDNVTNGCVQRLTVPDCAYLPPLPSAHICAAEESKLIQITQCSNVFVICHSRNLHFGVCDQDFVYLHSYHGCVSRVSANCHLDYQDRGMLYFKPIDNFCFSLQAGNYHMADCSPNYISCQDGQLSIESCLSNQLFDVNHRVCVDALQMSGCYNNKQNNQNVDQLPLSGPFEVEAYLKMAEKSRFCDYQPDGIYNDRKCGRVAVMCIKQKPYVFGCPYAHQYDPYSMRCNDAPLDCLNGAATAAAVETPQEEVIGQQLQQHVYDDDSYRRQRYAYSGNVYLSNEYCKHRAQGLHFLDDCVPYFAFCDAGNTAFVHYCDSDKVFDHSIYNCVDKVECDSKLAAYRKPIEPSLPSPHPEHNGISCQENVNYAVVGVDCESQYFVCQNGIPIPVSCTSGTLYDGQFSTCLDPHSSSRCNHLAIDGKEKLEETYHPPPPAQVVENVCEGRNGDLLADLHNCRKFYHCAHSKAYHKDCPDGTGFNAALPGCDHLYNLPQCAAGY